MGQVYLRHGIVLQVVNSVNGPIHPGDPGPPVRHLRDRLRCPPPHVLEHLSYPNCHSVQLFNSGPAKIVLISVTYESVDIFLNILDWPKPVL